MIYLKNILLIFLGLCSGAAVAGGIFALVTGIGIIPRMAAYTRSAGYVRIYESAILLGGAAGNIVSLYNILPLRGAIFLVIFGVSAGIFTGCLAVTIAEVVDTFPIFLRRAGVKKGLSAAVIAFALGKSAGALIFYIFKMYN